MGTTFEVVSVEDPALDRSKMNVRKYAETRDPALIVEHTRAVRWTLRDLTKGESDFCDDRGVSSPVMKMNFSLSYALLKVETAQRTFVPTKEIPDAESGGTKLIWTMEALAELQQLFGKSVLREISYLIMERDDRVGEAFGGDAVSFTLLPSSLAALDKMAKRQPAA